MNTRHYALSMAVASFGGLVLCPSLALAQACTGVSGQWSDSYGYSWNLTQSAATISGTVTLDCGAGWTVSGSVNTTSGSFQITASGGGCPSSTFTYSGSLSGVACNSGSGTWQNDLGSNGYWSWSKDCDHPDGEDTSTYAWTSPFYEFLVTLYSSSGLSFGGRTITESDGGFGTDGCWFSGSAFAPFNTVSTISAVANWANQYEDTVGWGAPAISYYRANGTVPCNNNLNQNVTVACTSSTGFTYQENAMAMTIGTTTVTPCRAGNCQSETY